MKECILLVDDDPEILSLVGSFLRKRDYEVITADNGQTGLAKARAHRPDLILTDVLMPQMDGYAFYKELKNDNLLKKIPVLIVTGRGKMEDSFKVIGADGFIAKPFTPDDLVSEIEHVFRITEAHRTPDAAAGRPALKEKKILALASEKIVSNDMIYQAKQAGYQLETVLTGADIIAKVISFLPDIIFMDIQPKDMSAYALVDVLRKLPQCADQPILGYCYYAADQLGDAHLRKRMLNMSDEGERFLRAGGTQYIGRYNHQLFIMTLAEFLVKKK